MDDRGQKRWGRLGFLRTQTITKLDHLFSCTFSLSLPFSLSLFLPSCCPAKAQKGTSEIKDYGFEFPKLDRAAAVVILLIGEAVIPR